jgi:hypothetical protein
MGSKFSYECHYCGKINHKSNKHSYVGKYCNNKCQASHQNKLKIEQWLSGALTGHSLKTLQVKRWVKNYLIEIRGNKCEICEISSWNGKNLTLQCDHIDGNAANTTPENLRIICPNCHSQTETYGNKGSRTSARAR